MERVCWGELSKDKLAEQLKTSWSEVLNFQPKPY